VSLEKLLVIGDTGLVGSKVALVAQSAGFEAYGTHNARDSPLPHSARLDITDRDATMRLVETLRPAAIINTAALHNVDYCETHREEAEKVNVEGTRNLAQAAAKNNCRLVHLSTDYVFDGSSGHYTEEDDPHPLHYYAQTKLESEKVASESPSYAIARPSVIFGWNPLEATGVPSSSGKTINFAMFVLNKLKNNQTVKAVRDQYSSPTFADNLADALLKLASLHNNGIFHTAGRSCISRYEFAMKLAELFGYSSNLVQPVFTSDFKQLAQRPKNSCLRVEKAEQVLGMRFLTAEEGISEMRKQLALPENLRA
jgi:dTDP-4-dehydrorhamnose reductase